MIQHARNDLLETQRPDGGWSQRDDMESDAYATGSALVALHQAGGLATDDAAYRRGLTYLISCQQNDGSWHVVSRSKPFQIYFESGYPHGKDQFISIAAAGWATTALALALPETQRIVETSRD
jgi:squalene cyclase